MWNVFLNQSTPTRWKDEKFQHITEFKSGRIIGFRKRGFSYRGMATQVQQKSSTVMRIFKQSTDYHWTAQKTDVKRRKKATECKNRHLLRMTVNDKICSFIHAVGCTLICCYRCTNVGFVNSLTSATPWTGCKGATMANPQQLCLQWAHNHRAMQVDCHQVTFLCKSRFDLWDHDGRIGVKCYAVQL